MRGHALRLAAAFLSVAGAALVLSVVAFGDDDPQPVDFTHNAINAPAPVASAVVGSGPAVKTGTAICTTATQATPTASPCWQTSSAGSRNESSTAFKPTN